MIKMKKKFDELDFMLFRIQKIFPEDIDVRLESCNPGNGYRQHALIINGLEFTWNGKEAALKGMADIHGALKIYKGTM
jgi:hypothetical protein